MRRGKRGKSHYISVQVPSVDAIEGGNKGQKKGRILWDTVGSIKGTLQPKGKVDKESQALKKPYR